MMPLSPWETKAVKHIRLQYAWIPFRSRTWDETPGQKISIHKILWKHIEYLIPGPAERSPYWLSLCISMCRHKTSLHLPCAHLQILPHFWKLLTSGMPNRNQRAKDQKNRKNKEWSEVFTLRKRTIWTGGRRKSQHKASKYVDGRMNYSPSLNGWLWGCNLNTAVWLEMKRRLNVYLQHCDSSLFWAGRRPSLRILLENGDLSLLEVQCNMTRSMLWCQTHVRKRRASLRNESILVKTLVIGRLTWSETLQVIFFFYTLVTWQYSRTAPKPRWISVLPDRSPAEMRMSVRWWCTAQ